MADSSSNSDDDDEDVSQTEGAGSRSLPKENEGAKRAAAAMKAASQKVVLQI